MNNLQLAAWVHRHYFHAIWGAEVREYRYHQVGDEVIYRTYFMLKIYDQAVYPSIRSA
jgi:hypothetical protein